MRKYGIRKYSLQNAYDVQLTKNAKAHQGIYSIARWPNLVQQSNNANYMNQERSLFLFYEKTISVLLNLHLLKKIFELDKPNR
jgi:hypothetical protein